MLLPKILYRYDYLNKFKNINKWIPFHKKPLPLEINLEKFQPFGAVGTSCQGGWMIIASIERNI